MKRFALLFIISGYLLAAEEILTEQPAAKRARIQRPASELNRTTALVFYGYGKKLSGYEDPLYVAEDKSDYLKSNAHTIAAEVTFQVAHNFTGDMPITQSADHLRVGLQLSSWLTPQGKNIVIPETGAPLFTDRVEAELAAERLTGLGFFMGLGGEHFHFDGGLLMTVDIRYEEQRLRRVIDADGNPVLNPDNSVKTEYVPGRGLFISDIYLIPTLQIRYGREKDIHLYFNILRGVYQYTADFVNLTVAIPLGENFRLDSGVGLAPRATLFLQPVIRYAGFEFALKGGLILNFYEAELPRVAITDSLYGQIAVNATF